LNEKANLKEIWELQQIDRDIQSLEERKEKLPIELVPFRQEWEATKQELAEMQKNFEAMQVERKSKEGEVTANEEEINKRNIQLYSLKSNKEYTSMIKEIEESKKINAKLEDEILELMEKSEQYKQVMKQKEKRAKEEEDIFKKEEERAHKEIADIESRLASRRQDRENQKNKVEPLFYQKYEKIHLGKHGLGIVAIVDNSCGGCHINLPPQIVNEVKMRNKMIFCESCSRLLYWEGD